MPRRRKKPTNPLPESPVPRLLEGLASSANAEGYLVASETGSQVLRERLDALRQQCIAAARRLEMGAALEREHSTFGMPTHAIGKPDRPYAERTAWQKNAEAVAKWLRGEAEILHRMGEGLQ